MEKKNRTNERKNMNKCRCFHTRNEGSPNGVMRLEMIRILCYVLCREQISLQLNTYKFWTAITFIKTLKSFCKKGVLPLLFWQPTTLLRHVMLDFLLQFDTHLYLHRLNRKYTAYCKLLRHPALSFSHLMSVYLLMINTPEKQPQYYEALTVTWKRLHPDTERWSQLCFVFVLILRMMSAGLKCVMSGPYD